MNTTHRIGALAAASALLLTACGGDSGDNDIDYKACMVSDAGGFDDASFNQAGYEGLLEISSELGLDYATAESHDNAEYEPNISALVGSGCDLIVTVGFLLADATEDAAAANSDVSFAIIDHAYPEAIDNVKPLTFATEEAAFLAGYAAAGTTQTGTVATFGGINIPPVTVFMEGFRNGVLHYNSVHGTDVTVLGWDGNDGAFTGDFEDRRNGQNLANGFIDQGADIILPVAGPVGLGAAAAARDAGDVWIIGVDSDWVVTAPEYADLILTSIMKQMGPAVFDVVNEAAAGAGFSNDPYVGTLENEGVGIADFRDAPVPADVASELEDIRAEIIAGNLG